MEKVSDALGYRITISNDGTDPLSIPLDLLDGKVARDLARTIASAFFERLGVATTVTFGEPGSLESTGARVSWKAART